MCSITRDKRGGFTAWINQDPEPTGIDVKDCWDLVVAGDCDDVARHVNLPRWDEKDCGEYKKILDSEQSPMTSSLSVVIESTKAIGIPTPVDSPKLQSRHQSPSKPAVIIESLPTKVLKQSALSFAPPPTSKDIKPKKKKTTRKPLPTTKPSASLNMSFATSKTTSSANKQAAKHSKVLFPGLAASKSQPSTIKEIPRTTSPPNGSNLAITVPSTSAPFDRDEIISPKGSSPKGMQKLLC
jgi:NAD-dependent histone deacetylase SIR2